MKCTIPEISWHNRDPVLSIDIQQSKGGCPPYRLVTGGTDSHVVIWYVTVNENGLASVEVAADLQRHQKAVNTVRFSPSGQYLASGDDESVIIIWKPKTEHDISELTVNENEVNKEQWVLFKFLRGHLEDVYDLSWSLDSSHLISGSIDNTAILWDVAKGRNLGILSGHGGFVQGVAWDPKNKYAATLSSDRTCRIHNVTSKKLSAKIYKTTLPVPPTSEMDGKVLKLFHDDTLKSFFRRLSFSPDGQLLVTPSGIIEYPDSGKHINATYIFSRYDFSRPVVYLPSPREYTVAVRFCPLLFQLHEGSSLFALPYRMVFAVATKSNVILYDTQQPEPIAFISNIHYTRLTDLCWSSDGKLLMASSTDGYCSIITFAENELGEEYQPPVNKPSESESQNTEGKQTEKSVNTGSSEIIVNDQPREESTETEKRDSKENETKGKKKISEPSDKTICLVDISEDDDDKNSSMNVDTDSKMLPVSNKILSKPISSSPKHSDAQSKSSRPVISVSAVSTKDDEPMEVDVSPKKDDVNTEEIKRESKNSKDSKFNASGLNSLPKEDNEVMEVEIIENKTDSSRKNHGKPKGPSSLDSSSKELLTSDKIPGVTKCGTEKAGEENCVGSSPVKTSAQRPTNENEKSPSKETSNMKQFCETTPSKCVTNGRSTSKGEVSCTSNDTLTESSSLQPSASLNVTPVANRTPRRVQLITLSSPKSKKKIL